MLRVAMVMGKMSGGGVEAVVMNYYRNIDRSRVQFDFLVDEDSRLVPRDEIEALGGRVFDVPPYQQLVRYQRRLVDLFRREAWPIVHSHINSLSVFSLRAAQRAGVPVRIAHSHSTGGREERLRGLAKMLFRTQANRYPTHRLACSCAAGEWLFGSEASFDVVNNAIDVRRFSFSEKARGEVRSELGIGSDTFVYGHVGRFSAQKNQEYLLRIFKKVHEAREDSVLLLAGDGEDRSLIESRAAEEGLAESVVFLGQRLDTARLYCAFDAFVLPSIYEGLPVVMVEAQASGLPCYVSERVTKEANIGGRVKFISLSDECRWVEELRTASRLSLRDVDRRAFRAYDIDEMAMSLVDMYETQLMAASGVPL